MRKTIIFLFLLSIQIFSQSYLNVLYSNSSTKTIDISGLTKITFNGTNVLFQLTSSDVATEGMSTISTITFGISNGGSPLPVELVSFIATADQNTITLSWYTATEVNNYGFNVERRVKNEEWIKIGFVQGHGNSNSPKAYSYKDTPQNGTRFQYRLKLIDFDGAFEYSSEIEIDINAPANFALKQNYPNPFNPETTITYLLPASGFVTLKIYDVLGREVATLVNEFMNAGTHHSTFSTLHSPLSSGVYICKMSSANYASSIKMLIMK